MVALSPESFIEVHGNFGDFWKNRNLRKNDFEILGFCPKCMCIMVWILFWSSKNFKKSKWIVFGILKTFENGKHCCCQDCKHLFVDFFVIACLLDRLTLVYANTFGNFLKNIWHTACVLHFACLRLAFRNLYFEGRSERNLRQIYLAWLLFT